jgi:putative ABC transport system ATP-binding protein
MEDSFILNQVKPNPIRIINPESVWNQQIVLECGKFYQVISPSGSGKSTLIGILNGYRKDFEGEISFNGKPLQNAGVDEWVSIRNQKISTVYQDLKLFDALTMQENISILDSFVPHKTQEFPILEWCRKLKIEEKMDTQVKFLSYGQKQRVAIIRALNRNFRWLMLDEPFSHLDSENMEAARLLITEECRRRNAGLIITGLDKRFVQNDFISLII